MKVLALELSASAGSVALRDQDGRITEKAVGVENGRTSAWQLAVTDLLNETGTALDSVDVFAAGRGPGRYSGIRVAVTAMQGLALPGGKSVRAICSGLALAREWMETHPGYRQYLVVGDARRDQIWYGRFRDGEASGDWQLTHTADLPGLMDEKTLVGSPDFSRLKPYLGSARSLSTWLERDVSPAARWIAQLAFEEEQSGTPAAAPVPVYLHPPVNAA
jgi:tRNA threonylcarbamoyl adenosine modification protein YeaZ